MSLGANKQALMGAAGSSGGSDNFYTHQIANSVRMSLSGNSTLKFTPSTPTSGKTFTYSWWFKKYDIASTSTQASNVFCAGTGGGTYVFWPFQSSGGKFDGNFTGGNFGDNRLTTNMKFRDPSAWYHCVLRFDSTQASTANRVRLYVNGEEPTYEDASVQSAIAQDGTYSFMNQSGVVQSWGGISGVGTGSEGVDCQLAEIVMCDGQSYAPTEFGETKNGVWIPKDPSGLTFGNNGYYLKFTNSSDLGEDFSGNNNDFTVANISSFDQMTDTPTNNFCMLNAVYRGDQTTAAKYGVLSKGNLQIEYSGSTDGQRPGTVKVPASGKWYFEYAITGGGGSSSYSPGAGIIDPDKYTMNNGNYNDTGSIQYVNSENKVRKDGSIVGTYGGTRGSNGDVMGIAADMDNGAFYVSKNGTWYAISGGSTGDPTSGASKTGAGATWTPASEYMNGMVPLAAPNGGSQPIQIFNFGQEGTFANTETAGGNSDGNGYGNFFSAVPSGYLAICTQNLTVADGIDPAQTDDGYPKKQFNMLQYTGNNSERTITTEFQLDILIVKMWQYAQNWNTLDTSRGLFGASSNNYYLTLDTNSAEAQGTQYNFKAQSGSSYTLTGGTWYNSGASGYQNWYWKVNGGTTSTPAGGSVATTVQANADAGVSIVQYVGDGGTSNFTLAHGLGKKPNMVLMKDRDSNGNNNQWHCFMIDAGTLPNNNYIYPSLGNAGSTSTNGTINSSTTTSTVLGVNRTSSSGGGQTISENGDDFLMYVFANIEGYSKYSMYVGNNSNDGTFVYTGFRPAFIWIKDYDSANQWRTYDAKNDPYNPASHWMVLDDNSARNTSDTTSDVDFLSNGFKLRGDASTVNGTAGNRYMYMAWASDPFKYGVAR